MRDGIILVEGDVGDEAGHAMRRGLLAVAGEIGQGSGHAMIAGTILGFGPMRRPIGPGMKRGSIVARDPSGPAAEVFPTFAPAGVFRPTWLTTYLMRLTELGFPVPPCWGDAPWMRWNGDVSCGGKGEVLTAD
jgi:formylmethanofuran dehydrogenase subunit C